VGAGVGEVAVALVALAATVWIAGLVGVVIATTSRSIADTALFTAVAVPLLAHMSGVFNNPVPDTYQSFLESVSPLGALHGALLNMTLGAGGGAGPALAVWAVTLPIVVGMLGPRLYASLGRVNRGGLEGA
jgi:hypothetical protein